MLHRVFAIEAGFVDQEARPTGKGTENRWSFTLDFSPNRQRFRFKEGSLRRVGAVADWESRLMSTTVLDSRAPEAPVFWGVICRKLASENQALAPNRREGAAQEQVVITVYITSKTDK